MVQQAGNSSEQHKADNTVNNTQVNSAPPKVSTTVLESKKFSSIVLAILALIAVLVILYAWRIPPFTSATQSTDNAMIQGQVTIISPQLSGYITAVNVQDFQQVEKGQVLAQIDDRIYQQKLDQAKANVAVQEATLASNVQDKLSAEANIRQSAAAIENADAQAVRMTNEFKRQSALSDSGAVSKSDFDATNAAYKQSHAAVDQAKAALQIAKQNLNNVIVKRSELEANLQQAQAALTLAQIDMDHTQIIAPEAGQLGQVNVRLGAYVSAGTQLMGIVPSHIWVIANMKETQMANIKTGQPVTFTVDALNGRKFTGKVERLAPATGSEFSVITPDNATGNFVKISQRIPVRIHIDDHQLFSDHLKPGMSVVVGINTR